MLVYNYVLKAAEEYSIHDTFGKKIASWEVEKEINEPARTNCRNCGAPVKGHNCEYCGTKY